MPKYWLDHIHLISPEPVKTAEFYEKMFGAKRISTAEPSNGHTIINLNLVGTSVLISKRKDDSVEIGLHHIGIGTDDLDKAVNNLKVKGVEFTKDITSIRPGFKISYLLAPENVSIELQEGSI